MTGLGLDEYQVKTLADGWDYEAEDVDTAQHLAAAADLELPTFVAIIDDIRAQVEKLGGAIEPRMNTASYIMYCYARAAAGLPMD